MIDETPSGDGEDALQRLAKARAVYERIFRALQASLDQLESGGDNKEAARERSALFNAHLKQFQSVFEIEGSLGKFGTSAGTARIDLDAARNEIRERLARIRVGGGS